MYRTVTNSVETAAGYGGVGVVSAFAQMSAVAEFVLGFDTASVVAISFVGYRCIVVLAAVCGCVQTTCSSVVVFCLCTVGISFVVPLFVVQLSVRLSVVQLFAVVVVRPVGRCFDGFDRSVDDLLRVGVDFCVGKLGVLRRCTLVGQVLLV